MTPLPDGHRVVPSDERAAVVHRQAQRGEDPVGHAVDVANAGSELLFELYRVPRDGEATASELTTLKLVVGPGDDGEPVMTILLPNED